MLRFACSLFTVLLIVCSPIAAFADEVVMLKNGDRISGKVLEQDGEVIVLETEYAGPVRIAARHVEKIQAYAKAGYDHVYVHQVGPDQEGFFRFYQQEVLPKFR